MPSIYDLKPAFQRRLQPLVDGLARAGVTANQVTVAAFVLSAAAGALVAASPASAWPLWLYPPVLLLRMALNAIDGQLARQHGQASRLGAMLNELGDVAADAALYLPLALVPRMAGLPAVLLVVLVVLAALTEMAGVLAVTLGASRRYDGPLGKSDRAFAMAVLAVALAAAPVEPAFRIGITVLLAALVALAAFTVYERVTGALAEASVDEERRG
jgi:CDP-diacylglycerol--glycerol-3-phosphate 3-phosphatidyltransferase